MKRFMVLMLVCLMLSGCGNTKRIGGVEYDVYGLANMDEKKNPNIAYEISIGSLVVAFIFCETIIVPIYVLLWDLYQPIGPKSAVPGQVHG